MRRSDPQGIEDAPQRRVRLECHALDVGRDLVEKVEAVIALGVAVDHPGAEQESLVLELLVQRRLARAERSDAQDRCVAIRV